MKKLMRFLKDEDGVTAIEYGLIAAPDSCSDYSCRDSCWWLTARYI